jgi:hypothetical protein
MVVKRSKIAATLAFVASLGFVAPAFADGDEPLDKVVGGSVWVTRLGGVAAGSTVGTPIAAVRQTMKAYRDWTPDLADKIGGKDCGPAAGLVSLVTLPAAIVWGGVTGPYYGIKNGMQDGFSNPFTHQSFSMDSDYSGDK